MAVPPVSKRATAKSESVKWDGSLYPLGGSDWITWKLPTGCQRVKLLGIYGPVADLPRGHGQLVVRLFSLGRTPDTVGGTSLEVAGQLLKC